ncbi:MAG: hypothetical protein L3K02_02865 [Thermoplasmata archaeon]|nr:hypothetical protein [Thermoplasmata archaeon]
MSRRALILAVVVLLIASSMIVLGPSAVRGASASSEPKVVPVHPAVGLLEMYTSSGEYPYSNITYYTTGTWYAEGSNILYFAAYDSWGDSSVKFTVTDPNASRDGLVNPVFSATVPINNTTFEYFSANTGVSFTFPADLKIGGGWNVTVSGTLAGNVTYPIYVGTYYENIAGSPEPYAIVLPGESITTAYQAISDANGAPDSSITNVSYNGYYHGANSNVTNLFAGGSVSQPAASLGSYTWTVPANATFDTAIVLNVWVSIYVGTQMAENESYSVAYTVGAVYIYQFYIESESGAVCPTDGSYDYYSSGSLVQACAVVGAFGGEDQFTPVPNLAVAINFWNGTNVVTPPGNTPTSMVSNATGTVPFAFWANSPQFSAWYQYPFYNSVNLTVTDPAAMPVPASNHDIAWYNQTFYVTPGSGSVGITVGLNQLTYYPGQTITATWAINPTNPSAGTVDAVAWYIYGLAGDFLGQGPISSTANTGTLTVTLPAGYTGPFTLEIFASNATESFEGQVSAIIVLPSLFLTPSSTTFTPGATETIMAQAWGDSGLTAPVITYEVYAEYGLGYTGYGGGGMVASGTVTNGSSFTINVPSTGAPDRYYVYAYLSSAAGTAATATLNVYQSWGYNVFVGVTTASSYSDGSYQPGQTVTVSYSIVPYGNAPLPTFYQFAIYLYGTQISSLISTPSTSGTVQVTIPSGWQTGLALLEVELEGTYLAGNSCGNGFCYGETGITINAHPSALSMEIGAGSGLTVGWLILLIIIIVVLVVLVLLIRRKKASPPSGGTSVTTPMNPPAPAPTGPGAAAWQEPSSPPPATDGQPPMPSPPPGAQ